MPKVMFTISYQVKPDVREQYLALIHRMKNQMRDASGKTYSVFETKGKRIISPKYSLPRIWKNMKRLKTTRMKQLRSW